MRRGHHYTDGASVKSLATQPGQDSDSKHDGFESTPPNKCTLLEVARSSEISHTGCGIRLFHTGNAGRLALGEDPREHEWFRQAETL